MQLLRNIKPIMMVTHPGQETDGGMLADDIGRAIDWCSPVLEYSIWEKPEGRLAENDIVSLKPRAHSTCAYSPDPEDLRALRDWVKAKRIHERQTEPVAAGFPAPPWHCG
jgi:hypothetical protein